jgi:hypothetical protein
MREWSKMGEMFEVWSWEFSKDNSKYEYIIKYSGEKLRDAVATMNRLKQDKIGCIKFIWRP